MMNAIKYSVVVYALLMAFNVDAQHLPVFGHYLVDPTIINPAFTGYNQDPVLNMSHRTQWVGLDGAPSTQFISWNARLKDEKNALGAMVYRDKLGVSSRVGVYGTYAHNYTINQSLSFNLGANAGLTFIQNKWTEVNTTDQNDQAFMSNSPVLPAPNFGFGANLYGKKFFVSFSIPEILSHTNPTTKIKIQHQFGQYNYLLGGGYKHAINREVSIGASTLVKYLPNSGGQFDLALFAEYKESIKAGFLWRSKDAIGLIFGVKITDQFRLSYMYDFTLSQLNTVSNGSHELNLSYQFKYKMATVNPNFF